MLWGKGSPPAPVTLSQFLVGDLTLRFPPAAVASTPCRAFLRHLRGRLCVIVVTSAAHRELLGASPAAVGVTVSDAGTLELGEDLALRA
ncbi:hypothetical protein AA983_14010 [Dermacoccus sp. PE3]|nr:hypothetical protein AA983_14010 [Dermacoccus sp. PE3]